jgi:hypothetical protein
MVLRCFLEYRGLEKPERSLPLRMTRSSLISGEFAFGDPKIGRYLPTLCKNGLYFIHVLIYVAGA